MEWDCNKILSRVDHTLLKPYCTWKDIKHLCDESVEYHTASVCIPPSFVRRVKEMYGKALKICTVIGFPLGYNTVSSKVHEAEEALQDGADEIDIVINLGDVKEHNYEKVIEEIKSLRTVSKGKILKVIIETCYLTKEEKIALCECVSKAQADYIKTSTGFGTGGATIEDIELIKRHIYEGVKMKASGGIRTKEDIEAYILAGCDRIGTSSAITITN